MSDVFVSYSRADTAAVRQLHDALIVHGKELWVDWDGIPKGVEFLDEIYRAIEAADVFLVVISPDSAASEICGLELAHALKYRKRLIPVVLRDAPVTDLPNEVAMINWIFLRQQDDFEAGIRDVVSVIETNPVWVRTHTRLLTQAVQWQTAHHDRSLLLRGRELEKVEQQLGEVTDEDSPRPTTLQRQFLAASRANMSRFWRNLLTSVSAALVAVILLAIFAWFQKLKADENALLAAEQADRYSRSTFSLQLGRVREELEQRSFDLASMLLADQVRCPKPLRSFAWGYYLDQSRRERYRLSGHTSAVNCLSLSADGNRIASSSDDRTIRLWDASSRTTTLELVGHEDEIWAVAFSPADPDMLVSGSRDGVVYLWNLNDPKSPRQICHRTSEFPAVTVVRFHPSGQSVAISHRDGFVQLLGTEDWELIGESKLDQRVSDLDWSPRGKTLVAACEDENVHLWKDDLTEHRKFVAHSGGVQALDFLDQPLQLITSGRDGKIRIWQDPAGAADSNMKPTPVVEVDANSDIHSIATSQDGKTIVWGTSVGSVHAWNRDTEQFEARFSIERDDSAQPLDRSIYSVCVLGGGSQLLTAVHDGTIRLWQLEDRSPIMKVVPPVLTPKAVYLNRSASVAGIITLDGDAFWRRLGPRASNDRLHPIESPPLLTPTGHSTDNDVSNPMAILRQPTAFHIAVSDDGSLIAPVFSRVNSLIVYRTEGQAGQFEVNGHKKPIGWAEFSKDSRLLATVDYDGLLLLHETSEGKLVASRNLGQPAYRIAFCPDGDRLSVALANGNIEVLTSTDLSRSLVFTTPVEGQGATDMTFDLARERLVVAMDGSVYCASTESGSSEMSLFIVADQTVSRLCCSPDDEILATGHQDGSIRMWDAKTGDLRGLIQGDETAVAGMFFHPSGRRLYVIDAETLGEFRYAKIKLQQAFSINRTWKSLDCTHHEKRFLPNRTNTMNRFTLMLLVAIAWISTGAVSAARPNILIAIADDQSYPHSSAYGAPAIKTPAFDRVARSGVLFRNAFTPAPGCSPMRAAFLTGREIWQNREAGTHASFFPRDLPVFTEQLAEAGYHVGMTGKGWGPGKAEGWPHNPAGKSYDAQKMDAPKGIRNTDYAANFSDFLQDRDAQQPFCFWYGCSEPHRSYDQGIGAKNGIDPSKIDLPSFLPDSEVVRSDVADYMYEIQWFDAHLQRMLDQLNKAGELENTLVIVTSDNGMPFPRAKANLYEYGIHMPLAISWPARIPAQQDTDELVSLIDVTRTIFQAAEVTPKQADQMPGRSLLSRFSAESDKTTPPRDAVFSGRERHSSSRYSSLGYPCRCIRTMTHLYIRNFTPERWPAGTPQKYGKAKFDSVGKLISGALGAPHGGYHDIDNGPTLQWMIAHRDEPQVRRLFAAAVDLRPREELYDIRRDPGCMNNLAQQASAKGIKSDLARRLTEYLTRTGDLRQTDPEAAHVWEMYPRVSSLRWFPVPDWANQNAGQIPRQDWLEKRRPR